VQTVTAYNKFARNFKHLKCGEGLLANNMCIIQVFQKARALQNNLVTHAGLALPGFKLTAIEVRGRLGSGAEHR